MSRGLFPKTDLMKALTEKIFGPSEKTLGTGSPTVVGPGDWLGSIEDCWCGRPSGHYWIGREDGAPHPRYPE